MLYTKVTHGIRDQVTTVTIENHYSAIVLSLFGGHLLSFTPKKDQRERLWVSPRAQFDKRKPIRGGIPVCWPWFGRIAAPAHGFARTAEWELVEHRPRVSGSYHARRS